MKMKKLVTLMLSALMLIMFSSVVSASTPLNTTTTITGQGTLKVTGNAYFGSASAGGVIFANVYKVENGTETLIESSRSNIFSTPAFVSYTINFRTDFPQGTYIIRYSYGGQLIDFTINASFS
ncbi:hypothetical protein [Paenibacillus pinihumi]|uniref:hypothetical protein n=1 Tax=Paenibacillus pinihumi TaxID=669462 RepID=UPI0004103D7C|nr:hypothetical protein [Paenibacillus pinihumi]